MRVELSPERAAALSDWLRQASSCARRNGGQVRFEDEGRALHVSVVAYGIVHMERWF